MDTAAFVARIEIEFDSFRIPHPRLVEVGRRLTEMRGVAQASRADWIARGKPRKRMPQLFLPVIAPSGSGKSTSVNMYLEDVVAREVLGKDQRPVVHVTLSSEATTKRLGSDILEEFGWIRVRRIETGGRPSFVIFRNPTKTSQKHYKAPPSHLSSAFQDVRSALKEADTLAAELRQEGPAAVEELRRDLSEHESELSPVDFVATVVALHKAQKEVA